MTVDVHYTKEYLVSLPKVAPEKTPDRYKLSKSNHGKNNSAGRHHLSACYIT